MFITSRSVIFAHIRDSVQVTKKSRTKRPFEVSTLVIHMHMFCKHIFTKLQMPKILGLSTSYYVNTNSGYSSHFHYRRTVFIKIQKGSLNTWLWSVQMNKDKNYVLCMICMGAIEFTVLNMVPKKSEI